MHCQVAALIDIVAYRFMSIQMQSSVVFISAARTSDIETAFFSAFQLLAQNKASIVTANQISDEYE